MTHDVPNNKKKKEQEEKEEEEKEEEECFPIKVTKKSKIVEKFKKSFNPLQI